MPNEPGMIERIRAFVSTLGDDTAEPGGDESATVAEPVEAVEPDGDESAESAEIDHADGETDSEETTPGGAEDGDAEMADLRAKIIDQAAMIETLKNMVAELGGDSAELIEDNENEDLGEPSEDEAIAAFDEDYAKQVAMLADLKES